MAKVILVMEEPEKCTDCICMGSHYINLNADKKRLICREKGKIIKSITTKPDWCPLKSLPKKSNTGLSDKFQWGDWEDGWNACIDEISKEEKHG